MLLPAFFVKFLSGTVAEAEIELASIPGSKNQSLSSIFKVANYQPRYTEYTTLYFTLGQDGGGVGRKREKTGSCKLSFLNINTDNRLCLELQKPLNGVESLSKSAFSEVCRTAIHRRIKTM